MRNGKNTAICLASVRKRVGKSVTLYRLYLIRCGDSRRYAIRITCGDEEKCCCFGRDSAEALRAFGRVVEGSVTPCTLEYVAEDLAIERQLSRR